MSGEQRFTEHYKETIVLRDGTPVELRLVTPLDKELIARGFERLSPESRYRRFLSTKTALSDRELCYLTELDGIRHLAIGATRRLPGGQEEGLGVARFIRLADDPECAEAAVAVVDEWQGRGLGRLLLERLIQAARERGIVRFRAHVLASNSAVNALVRDASFPVKIIELDAGAVALEVALPATLSGKERTDDKSAAHRLLSVAAAGSAQFRSPGPPP